MMKGRQIRQVWSSAFRRSDPRERGTPNFWLVAKIVTAAVSVLLLAITAIGATNSIASDDPLKLLPPYGELPPTFWEQNGTMIVLVAIAVIAATVLIIWLWSRPKPPVILPPEVQARQALNPLLNRSEDGALLSSVSQILRRYVIAAFELPPGEPTTAEFCRALSADKKIGSELSAAVADFLRQCDERKFSLRNPSEPMSAVNRALELVAMAEARRVRLRQIATAAPQPASPASA